MKYSALVAALLALSLSACGEKAAAPTAPAVEAPAAVSAPVAAEAASAPVAVEAASAPAAAK